jgi:hypothetical protein
MSVYFGGSRSLPVTPIIAQVISAVVAAGHHVHAGCQFGADAQVITAFLHTTAPCSQLHLFAVSHIAPQWFGCPASLGAHVTLSAGGTAAPMPARYLLRSIAAFQGCSQAVFFSPGAGSLAVARECVKSGLPVFAFQQTQPAPIPSCKGVWCITWFHGFQCWGWGTLPEPKEKQLSFI